MRAAVVRQLGAPLALEEVAYPDCPRDGAILRVQASGICRTDWALWAEDFWEGGPGLEPPFVLGHEFAGTVVEVGSEVRRWRQGDRVTFPMNPGDGSCATCLSGNQNLCEHVDALVPGVSYWGAFAEYVAVRYADVNMVALPGSLDFVGGASLGCRYIAAFHGIVEQIRVRGGEWVVVHGAGGGAGLASVQIAAAVGANVIAVDYGGHKLGLARELGAAHTVDAGQHDPAAAVRELTGGGAHVSVDAVGIAVTCRASIDSLRTRGRHLQLGHTTRAERGAVPLPIDVMMVKDLEFRCAWGMAGQQTGAMLAMIEAGRLDPARLVTRTVPLDEAGAVLASMASYGTSGVVVIDRF